MKMPTMMAALICAALTLPTTAIANDDTADAETVREFNLMLMATSLRCRTTRFDFRAEYEAFSRYNLHHLNRAHDVIRNGLTARLGQFQGQREFDRFDSDMANRYGGGHPWLNCAELRDVALWLAEPHDRATIIDVAWDLLYPVEDSYYRR